VVEQVDQHPGAGYELAGALLEQVTEPVVPWY